MEPKLSKTGDAQQKNKKNKKRVVQNNRTHSFFIFLEQEA
jgi:hypothetical protein